MVVELDRGCAPLIFLMVFLRFLLSMLIGHPVIPTFCYKPKMFPLNKYAQWEL
jgi:hypothetical protein